MGIRISFIRVDADSLENILVDRDRLLKVVFNPELRGTTVVISIDKSLQGIEYLLTGNIISSVDEALVNNWNFSSLVGDRQNGNVYFQKPLQVQELNGKLNNVDFAVLKKHFDPYKLSVDKIFPELWNSDLSYDGFEYLRRHFDTLQKFYSIAAFNCQAVVCIPA